MAGNITLIGEETLPNSGDQFAGVTVSRVGGKKALDVATSSTALTVLVDEPSSTLTYVGVAQPGTATSAASWQIKRILVSGAVTQIQFASGNSLFDKIWDNRASLSYS